MAQSRTQHPNAVLTPRQRRAMVDVLLVEGWCVAATAERFGVDPKTVRKWRDRFVADGQAALLDRSSRPHRCPRRTPEAIRAEVIELRSASVAAQATSPMWSVWRPRRASTLHPARQCYDDHLNPVEFTDADFKISLARRARGSRARGA